MDLSAVYILIFAFVLDLLIGDPKKMPHLIVLFGKTISTGEQLLNKKKHLFFKGLLLTVMLVTLAFCAPFFILTWFKTQDYALAYYLLSVLWLFYCLANRTLIKEGYAVFNVLNNEGPEAGRKRLSWIVGRETNNLNTHQIRTATLETMAENLSDGVIAPLFYYMVFGVPGAMAYKMINTLDSMIGYKNERYLKFGKFAAKLDDLANFIPARITAILMLVAGFKLLGIGFVIKEGKKHSSPNAGYPEAALAYILDCRFGGPNYYHGELVEKPFIGYTNREIKHNEINKVALINYKTSILFVIIIIGLNLARHYV